MASKFELDLSRFMKKVKTDHSRVIGKIGMDILTNLVTSMPVDTGRAKGNTFTTVGSPARGTTDPVISGEPRSQARASANEQKAIDMAVSNLRVLPDFPVIYIVNNLPYVKRLNEGSSMQAPAGFVELSIDRAISPFNS